MLSLRKVLVHAALTLTLASPSLALTEEKPVMPSAKAATEAALDGITLHGTILETMNSSGYTYLLLNATQGKIWVAIPETQVSAGQTVLCTPGMTMHNFTSKTLNRTFETIVFSPGINIGDQAAGQVKQQAAPVKDGAGFGAALQAEGSGAKANGGEVISMEASPGSAGAVVPSSTEVNVNKATGANSYSVSESFEQGKQLNGTTIRVRGKVMKISRMIMGKNWLHIQDGTGDPLKNQHDLVVTTMEEVPDGEVVTVVGKLSADRDFGAGYKYDVIIEDAKIEQ